MTLLKVYRVELWLAGSQHGDGDRMPDVNTKVWAHDASDAEQIAARDAARAAGVETVRVFDANVYLEGGAR